MLQVSELFQCLTLTVGRCSGDLDLDSGCDLDLDSGCDLDPCQDSMGFVLCVVFSTADCLCNRTLCIAETVYTSHMTCACVSSTHVDVLLFKLHRMAFVIFCIEP